MSREDFLKSIEYKPKSNSKHYKGKKGTFEKIKNFAKIGIATALAGLTIAGIASCSKKDSPQPTITSTTEITEQTTTDKYDELSTSDKILEDFKTRYIQAYNKEHGTSLSANEIELNVSFQNYLFKTQDNKYTTHGSLPDETKKILSQFR